MSINLFASSGSASTLMGMVAISLAEVLIFPQNKIQLTTKVMSIVDECDHSETYCGCNVTLAKPKHLGNLTLWFRLTCELDVLKSLYNEIEQWRTPDSQHLDKQPKNVDHSNFDVKQVSSMTIDQPKDEKMLVTITIQCLQLNETFEICVSDQIHIECNFLGSRRLKTDQKSLASHQLVFNFTQTYSHNERNLQRLTSILKDLEHSIKLILIKTNANKVQQENANTSDDESKTDSLEIGFGLLHLGKIISESSDASENAQQTITIPILSRSPPYQNIGHLDISIENIASLKRVQQQN